jgi:polar amino acid transport system substrate-binding protein
MCRFLIAFIGVLTAVLCNGQTESSGQGQKDLAAKLAPSGTLRAAFLGDNPALGQVDANTGNVTGPVADLVKELARRLGVSYKLIPAAGARDIMDRLKAQTADIGFLAYNAGRAKEVDFSNPWLLMPNTYIVSANSPLKNSADADRAGVLVAAVKNDTQDVYLSANLKNAKVKAVPAMPTPEEMEKMLVNGEIAAFAANKQRLVQIGERFPRLRVLPDSFFVAGQAAALPKGDPSTIQALNHLLDEILSTNVVKDSIAHAGLKGVDAAAPHGH